MRQTDRNLAICIINIVMISQGKVFCKKKGEWRWSIKWNGEKKSGDFGMESMQASVGGWRVMLCAVELSPHPLHHYHYQRFIIRNRIFIMLNFAQICKASWAHSAMNMPPSIDYQSISISYFLSSPLWSHAQFTKDLSQNLHIYGLKREY